MTHRAVALLVARSALVDLVEDRHPEALHAVVDVTEQSVEPHLVRDAPLLRLDVGFGRIAALCYRSSTLYQIHEEIQYLYF